MEEIARLGVEIDARSVKDGTKALDDFAASGKRAEDSTNKLQSATVGLANIAKTVAGAYATLKLAQYAQEAAMLSSRYETLGVVLNTVGRNAGYTAKELQTTVTSMEKLGISMLGSREQAVKLIQSHIDLANATKLARIAQDAAVIANVNSTEAFDRMLHGIRSGQTENLRTLGLNVTLENSYEKYAKALGVTTASLDQNQKVQAVLNAVMKEGETIAGAYESAMDTAGKQIGSTARLIEDLKVKTGELFDQSTLVAVQLYVGELKDLNAAADAAGKNGSLQAWGDSVARTFAYVIDAGHSVIAMFNIIGKGTGALGAMGSALMSGNLGQVGQIAGFFKQDFQAEIALMSKARDMVEANIIKRDMLTKAIDRETIATRQSSDAKNIETGATDHNSASKAKAFDMELYKLKQYSDEAQKARQLTESLRTKQEIYNDTLKEYETLKPYLTAETYNRALAKAATELNKVEDKTKTTTDSVSQMWIQAGRNIQTAFGNLVFDFFNNGLDGMVASFKNAVLRVVSEMAGLKISQSLGLANLFTVGGSGIGGNALSLGSGALSLGNMFKSGFGSLNLLSGAGRLLPGAAGSFFGGLGGSTAGVFSAAGGAGTAFIGGPGTALGGVGMGGAASMGASMAALAGPALALVGVDIVGRLLAGDKKLGGAEMIPVIGGFLAAMFGRGPYKFRQQSLQGTYSSEGFTGDITDVYRSAGGLFMGNKHKSITNALSRQLELMLDSSIQGFYDSTHQFVENLGLDVKLVDNFSKEIQIKSEKKQKLTDEAINEMLASISDSLVKNVIPDIENFAKLGETSLQTLSRLNSEYLTLVNSAALVLGKSLPEARKMILGSGFADRTALIDKLGGEAAFEQDVSFFAQNFLTEAERLKPVQESLNEELAKLGLSSNLTMNQFKELVQSFGKVNGISAETLAGLFKIQEAFVQVKNASISAAEVLAQYPEKIAKALGAGGTLISATGGFHVAGGAGVDPYLNGMNREQEKLVKIAVEANRQYEATSNRLTTLRESIVDLNKTLKSFKDSLDLGEISGLSPSRQYLAAKNALSTATADNVEERVRNFLDLSRVRSTTDLAYRQDVASSKLIIDRLIGGNNSQISGIDASMQRASSARSSSITSFLNSSPYLMFKALADPTGALPDELAPFASLIFGALAGTTIGSTALGRLKVSVPKLSSGTKHVPREMLAMLHPGEKVTPAGYNNDVTNKEVIEKLSKMNDNVAMLKDEYAKFNTFLYQLISEGSSVAFNTRTV